MLEMRYTGDDEEENCQQGTCQCGLEENTIQLVGGVAWVEEDQHESEYR